MNSNEFVKSKECLDCEKWKSKVLKNSPMIKFMLKELEKAGCPITPSSFICQPCDASRAGGFSPSSSTSHPHGSILLCENQLTSRQHTEDTMAHELIHAFDQCSTHIQWNNLSHLACSEIRAATLSGECRWTREFQRGVFGFLGLGGLKIGKHFQECVRRRATLGVSQAAGCKDMEEAKLVVADVWDSCFPDMAPFDDIY